MHLGKNNQGQLLLLEWQHRKVLINTSKMYFNIAGFGGKNTAFLYYGTRKMYKGFLLSDSKKLLYMPTFTYLILAVYFNTANFDGINAVFQAKA